MLSGSNSEQGDTTTKSFLQKKVFPITVAYTHSRTHTRTHAHTHLKACLEEILQQEENNTPKGFEICRE